MVETLHYIPKNKELGINDLTCLVATTIEELNLLIEGMVCIPESTQRLAGWMIETSQRFSSMNFDGNSAVLLRGLLYQTQPSEENMLKYFLDTGRRLCFVTNDSKIPLRNCSELKEMRDTCRALDVALTEYGTFH